MKAQRPNFKDIHSFEEFNCYYWYREELSQICKSLELEYQCTKKELNFIIEQYFKGNKITRNLNKDIKTQTDVITLETPLLYCGFSFNQKFRDYFSAVTGISPFKFSANMATAWRKVKKDKDINFTIQDMIKIYYGESDYAKYDSSTCQWNQFLKDFCLDECSNFYSNKLKVASILWKEVKNSTNEKIYTKELLKEYEHKVKEYRKEIDSSSSN